MKHKKKKNEAFKIMAGVFGTWYVICMLLLCFYVKERQQSTKQRGLCQWYYVTLCIVFEILQNLKYYKIHKKKNELKM